MRAEADARENGGCQLVRPRRPLAVEHVDDARTHCLNDTQAWPPVVDEKVGDVVTQREPLLLGIIGRSSRSKATFVSDFCGEKMGRMW